MSALLEFVLFASVGCVAIGLVALLIERTDR